MAHEHETRRAYKNQRDCRTRHQPVFSHSAVTNNTQPIATKPIRDSQIGKCLTALSMLAFKAYQWRLDICVNEDPMALSCSTLSDYTFCEWFGLIDARGVPLSSPLQQQKCSANNMQNSHARRAGRVDLVHLVSFVQPNKRDKATWIRQTR